MYMFLMQNGCTARDVALFERRDDVIETIDEHVINLVRDDDVTSLTQLAVDGYDRIIIQFQVLTILRL